MNSEINESPIVFELENKAEIEPYNPTNITIRHHQTLSTASVKDLLDCYIFSPSPLNSNEKNQNQNQQNQQHHQFTELCRKCFNEKDAREIFLQTLDEKRGRNSLLTQEQYDKMKTAMKVFLDKCQEYNDVKAALRIANMSITFHKRLVFLLLFHLLFYCSNFFVIQFLVYHQQYLTIILMK